MHIVALSLVLTPESDVGCVSENTENGNGSGDERSLKITESKLINM